MLKSVQQLARGLRSVSSDGVIMLIFLLHPMVLCTACKIFGQVAEAVQYIISDSELTQSVQRNNAVYNIKCTGYIKQDEDCSPMSFNEQIVLCFEQGCVWCFCLYAHCKTSWDPLWIKSWFINLTTTTRSMIVDKRRGWRLGGSSSRSRGQLKVDRA